MAVCSGQLSILCFVEVGITRALSSHNLVIFSWDDLNRSPKHSLNQRRRGRDEGRAQQDCCNGPADDSDEKKDRARKGGRSWSEDNDSGRPVEGETHNGNLDCGGLTQNLTDMSAFPLNVGTMSIASWDGASEPTVGTDAGTDQDVAATSGIPEGNSEDEDEDDDMFEVADSLDLGAVALRVSLYFTVLHDSSSKHPHVVF